MPSNLKKLQLMKIGSVAIDFAEDVDYTLDEKYKTALYLQTSAFLNGITENFVSLSGIQNNVADFYRKINS